MKNRRIFYHYSELEENDNGFWSRPTGDVRKTFIELAAALMRDASRFKEAMSKASKQWVKSSEHNLTSLDSNRIAWLGHAGCCLETGSPEECTRAAWHTLSIAEQDDANRVAAEVLAEWDRAHGTDECLSDQLELMF